MRNLVYTAIPKYLNFAHDYILSHVVNCGKALLTPYTGTFWLLDTVERDAIRDVNKAYLSRADECWVFGARKDQELAPEFECSIESGDVELAVTDGVLEEFESAEKQSIPTQVYSVDVDTQEIHRV